MLEGRGVDLFMLETFFDLDELVSAVEAVRGVSSLPIVALLTFDDEAEIAGGIDAAPPPRRLAELDVAAIGTNHGAGPHAALTALDAMRGAGLPLAALPNIGLASIVGGRVVYPHSTPEYFGDFAAQAVALGARIVGGCCGTTPAQIEAIRAALDDERAPRAAFEARERAEPPVAVPCERRDGARAGAPRRRVGRQRRARPAEGRHERGDDRASRGRCATRALVGFVDVNDNPMARARMNALMASIAIQREAGIETIPHVTPRDTTVMGLEGVLLGAHAEGVRNILAVTGDPPHVGDYPGSRGVYEIDSIGLVQLLAGLNDGVDYVGKAIDRPTSFFIGVAVNPSADDPELELERFERKVAAGAQFAMTQALFDLDGLDRLPGAARRQLADPAPRAASGRCARTRWRCACTTRCRASRCPSACSSAARRRRRRAGGRARAGARPARRAPRPRRRGLRDPAVQAARGGARPARVASRLRGEASASPRASPVDAGVSIAFVPARAIAARTMLVGTP